MKLIALLFVVLNLIAVASAAEKPAAAWWYEITFVPEQVAINKIPINKFDSAWVYANALTEKSLQKRISKQDLHEFTLSRFRFRTRDDLNKDGQKEEFFVGVYKTRSGEEGRFLAIVQQGKILKTFTHAGSPGFSAILRTPNSIRWYSCMQCDDYETVSWAKNGYFLQ